MEPTLPNPNTNTQASDGAENSNYQSLEQPLAPSPELVSQPPAIQTAQPLQDDQVAAQPLPAQPAQSADSVIDQGVPAIADDVDVIEKEWVDRAKKIVNSTKDNPREQEKEVSKLQADYLMKRYGKQVKIAE